MSGYRLALPFGTRIDRSRPLRFRFEGRPLTGFAGDTLASALLAQGVMHVGRSFKLHRPRGILSCGVEEPTGLLDVGQEGFRTPNTRATDVYLEEGLVARPGNCWPSLRFDVGALNQRLAAYLPAGFYYKTFMWPHWHVFEPVIRRMAGLGVAADRPDPEEYAETSMDTDTLVVGGGAAGIQAALAAARSGRSVTLVEAEPELGGWLQSQALPAGNAANADLEQMKRQLQQSGVRVLRRTTLFGLYDHHFAAAIETADSRAPTSPIRERLWKIRARRIVLATGALERPMLFPGNDRPGVMLASAVERYAALYGVACGRRIVIATGSDKAYGVAHSLAAAGIEVAAIVDRRPPGQLSIEARPPAGTQVFHDCSIVALSGVRQVSEVQIAESGGSWTRTLDADIVASCAGLAPNVSLYSQAGGALRWDVQSSMFVPDRAPAGIACVGACAGVFDFDAALDHAQDVGNGDRQGAAPVGGLGRVPADTRPTRAALSLLRGRPDKQFVDLQNDVTADDVELAARENYRSVEHLKRYTTTGMGTDQGKTSNVNALVLMGAATDREPQDVGTTRFRPPYKPVTMNAMAAGRSGKAYRPLKRLSAREFHAARGALFEEFGSWERPAAYPRRGESLLDAARREALAVRSGVGVFDASPLGKIEVYGPDAAAFLDLMYVGTMSSLAVGSARYGVLLNENGVVVDDGIVARLAPDHFWVNTTSGGVERTAAAFEEWLQCEYFDMQVLVTPVTSQWGNVTVSGPRAWTLLSAIGFDEDLAPSVMKHMTMRQAQFQGDAVRVLRASFNGELGYEINLPASRTQALLQLLWTNGQELGICAYGVEALMVMRIEKGFIHVGADTDGTTLPGDVGLARGVERKKANFVGRRSLLRPAAVDPDRLQLVGLESIDRKTLLPVGAHLSIGPPPNSISQGHVTSSCLSPTLGRPIALGMLRRGLARVGERLTVRHLGTAMEAEVVKFPFFDPAGDRVHG